MTQPISKPSLRLLSLKPGILEIIKLYANLVGQRQGDVLVGLLKWSLSGRPGGTTAPAVAIDDARTRRGTVWADHLEVERLTVEHYKQTGVLLKPTKLIEQAALHAPSPADPHLLDTFLPDRQPLPGRTSRAKALNALIFSKRQTSRLRHLAQAWSMTVPDVVQVLVASNPCMHLPSSVTPPLVTAALRGVHALPAANDQETILIEG